jgi:hypothetical protein
MDDDSKAKYDAIVKAFLEWNPRWRADLTYQGDDGEPYITTDGLRVLTRWAYARGLIMPSLPLETILRWIDDQEDPEDA